MHFEGQERVIVLDHFRSLSKKGVPMWDLELSSSGVLLYYSENVETISLKLSLHQFFPQQKL